MTAEVRELTFHDDAFLGDYHRLHQRALGYGRPHFVPMSEDQLATILRTSSERWERRILGLIDQGHLVGAELDGAVSIEQALLDYPGRCAATCGFVVSHRVALVGDPAGAGPHHHLQRRGQRPDGGDQRDCGI
ncbi:hypothetical protein KEM60_00744 [Austwickia sp. TVS 96-490-7B]|uniref:hypothetical protein n=1 Tax=Austwickia sp. TVS 96-490-7B TaxID=2830843 RepID=UPI001C564685|nr:hypothetical protein [Austwickia sp. TVS 96-490-7B]MBW3084556.1 hypothetical protein [Austwickia sp. TVS 96-490-7B]